MSIENRSVSSADFRAYLKLQDGLKDNGLVSVQEAIKDGADVNDIFMHDRDVRGPCAVIWRVDYRILALLVKNGFTITDEMYSKLRVNPTAEWLLAEWVKSGHKITDRLCAKLRVDPEGVETLARFRERIHYAQILVTEKPSKQLLIEQMIPIPVLVSMILDYDLSHLEEISDEEYIIEKPKKIVTAQSDMELEKTSVRYKVGMRYKMYIEDLFPHLKAALCWAIFNNVRSNYFSSDCGNKKHARKFRFKIEVGKLYGRAVMGGLFDKGLYTKYQNELLFTIIDYVRD